MKCLVWCCYVAIACIIKEVTCNERRVTVLCGNDMGCSCVIKEHVRYAVINELMTVRYALLKGNEDEIEGMKVYSDDVRIEGVVRSSKDENVYEVYIKYDKEMADEEKVCYVDIVFEYVVVNGIRKEYRSNSKDDTYVNSLLWKIKHQNYLNVNETLHIELILSVNTTFNETVVTSSIQRNNTSIITTNNINTKTIIFTYNPIILPPKGVIVYYTEFPFYFSSCSIQALSPYAIIFTFLFLLCLMYLIHFILSSILIGKRS